MENRLSCLTVLDEIEYIPISTATEELVHHAINRSLLELGKTGSKAVIQYICSVYGLSENELLTNYDLFEKSIYESLGPAATKIILSLVKKQLLRDAVVTVLPLTIQDITQDRFSIRELIKQLNYEEILNFVGKITTPIHFACLYETSKFRKQVISTFFKGRLVLPPPKCMYISVDKSNFDLGPDIENVTYKELSEEPRSMVEKILGVISKHSSAYRQSRMNSPVIRIAEEDACWWLKNGYTEELQILEECLGRNLKRNLSLMCAFDISKLSRIEINSVMRNILRHHSHVIMENPPGLYGPCEHPFLKNLLRDDSLGR